MMRRGFLQALFASPAAAVAAQEAVGNALAIDPGLNPVGDATSSEPIPPLMQKFFRARERLERKDSIRTTPIIHYPPHISEKKSWSPAFKQSVFLKEEMERFKRNAWRENPTEEFMRMIISKAEV